jgi:hypothetical protein
MSGERRPHRFVFVVAFAAVIALNACARALHQPQPRNEVVPELWQQPRDLESRDLFHGAGGTALTPRSMTYRFVAEKAGGTNPGYDVRDAGGRLWSVKLGDEAQSEVTASRVLWAIGFHQPSTYYVERWQLSGADVRLPPPGRFRLERPSEEVVGEWSWYDNPFIGSREFSALITVNLLLGNWDLKTPNNKIYVVSADGVRVRRYIVRDLGASLGKARQPRFLTWFPFMRQKQGSKNNLEDFEAHGFVKGIDGEKIDFDYRGLDRALANSVTAADLRWACALLSRLSERQWLDAFRAGGYTLEQRTRYVRKIRDKIASAHQLARVSSSLTEAQPRSSRD